VEEGMVLLRTTVWLSESTLAGPSIGTPNILNLCLGISDNDGTA
jgi:hypothetical protein